MARVGRLAGALLAETRGEYYLVGNTKEPCDFASVGFERPPQIDAVNCPYLRLEVTGTVALASPWLAVDGEGEELAASLAKRMLIERNGSVSERLWRLIMNPQAPEDGAVDDEVSATWLLQVPEPIWGIVRDTVLRCS